MQSGKIIDRPRKRLYSIKEAGEYLGLSVWSIRERVWSGELPFVRPDPVGKGAKEGRRILLDLNDLDRWIDAHKTREQI